MRQWGDLEVIRAFSVGMEEQPSPPVDMYETEGDFVIECDLPGAGLDQLTVALKGRTVVIECGAPKKQPKGGTHQYHCLERSPEAFVREIDLPGPVRGGESSASYGNGVLIITLPKVTERRGRSIMIPVRAESD